MQLRCVSMACTGYSFKLLDSGARKEMDRMTGYDAEARKGNSQIKIR